jgi:hypothetical protein
VLVKIWKKIDNDEKRKEVVVGKLPKYLCLTLIIKELKISVEHDRVVTTLNIKFNVATPNFSNMGPPTDLLLKLVFDQSFGDWHL